MKLTRRGLFKTLAGAFVATKSAPLLPAAPPPLSISALIDKRMEDAYAEMGRQMVTPYTFRLDGDIEIFILTKLRRIGNM